MTATAFEIRNRHLYDDAALKTGVGKGSSSMVVGFSENRRTPVSRALNPAPFQTGAKRCVGEIQEETQATTGD